MFPGACQGRVNGAVQAARGTIQARRHGIPPFVSSGRIGASSVADDGVSMFFMGCARRVARLRNSCQSGGQQADGEAATGGVDEAWRASTAPSAGAGTE